MRSAAHIAVLNRLALAAAGGCYVGAPPRPAARSMKFFSLLCPVTPNIAGTACIKACLSLFPGRVSAPSHPLDGRKTAIPPAEQARSALRRRCGMQFASRTRTAKLRARAGRATRRRCADTRALRSKNSKRHSEAAGVSRASGQAEVCGPVCLATAGSGSIRKVPPCGFSGLLWGSISLILQGGTCSCFEIV